MNTNNEFDRLIKDKLADEKPSVPKDAKADIERELVNQGLIKKGGYRGKLFYVVFSVIAFFSILTVSIFVNNRTEKNIPTIENYNANKNTYVSNRDSENQKQLEVDKESDSKISFAIIKPLNNNQTSERNNKVNKQTIKNSYESKDNSSKPSIYSVSKAGKNKSSTLNPKSGKYSDTSSSSNMTFADNSEKKNVSANKKSELTKAGKSEVVISGAAISSNGINLNTESVDKNISSSQNSSTDLAINTGVNNNENAESNQSLITNDSTLKSAEKDTMLSDSAVNKVPVDTLQKASSTDSIKLFSYSIETFAGLQQAYMQNETSTNGSNSSTQSGSNSNWIAGLKLNLFYRRHFTFGAGVNYSKCNSEIAKEYTSFVLDSGGMSTIVIPAQIKTEFNITEIPLLIGYYFEANKFAFHIESGVSISLISNASSTLYFNNGLEPIDNFSGVSVAKSYSNFIGQVSVLYSLGQHFQVFLQPTMNVGLSEILIDMPDKKINVLSGRAGLRVRF